MCSCSRSGRGSISRSSTTTTAAPSWRWRRAIPASRRSIRPSPRGSSDGAVALGGHCPGMRAIQQTPPANQFENTAIAGCPAFAGHDGGVCRGALALRKLLPLQPRFVHHLVPALELGGDVAPEQLAGDVGRLEAKLGELTLDLGIA